MTALAAEFMAGAPTVSVSAESVPEPPTFETAAALDAAITARIASAKRRLAVGGLLRSIEWGRRTGKKDVRGRRTFTYFDAGRTN